MIEGLLLPSDTTPVDLGSEFAVPCDKSEAAGTGLIGSIGTGCRMIGGRGAADIGITPVESSGTTTSKPPMMASAVNAVAMGQRFPLRGADDDSSSVSPNIFLTSMEVI
jgi:hypothetical protein